MPTIKKEAQLVEISERLKNASAVWLVDYRGLSVKQSEDLRGVLRECSAELKVYKNTLTAIALKELDMPSMDEYLAGPTGFVFVTGDPVASAKAIKTFATANPLLEIKGGMLEGAVMSIDQVKAVAELPSREELIAKLLGTMQNPMQKIVRVLNGPAEKFARVLGAIADQKNAA